jgi:hypothetical protein
MLIFAALQRISPAIAPKSIGVQYFLCTLQFLNHLLRFYQYYSHSLFIIARGCAIL